MGEQSFSNTRLRMVKLFWPLLLLLDLFFMASAAVDHLHLHQSVFSIKSNQTERSSLYTAIIKTSCSSVSHTMDEISLAFGDAYGNEVHAPRIDDEHAITFERCSRYVFEVRGPRMDVICFLALMSNGSDGWRPETVTIYVPDYYTLTYSFDTFLPNGEWFMVTSCSPHSESAYFSSALF